MVGDVVDAVGFVGDGELAESAGGDGGLALAFFEFGEFGVGEGHEASESAGGAADVFECGVPVVEGLEGPGGWVWLGLCGDSFGGGEVVAAAASVAEGGGAEAAGHFFGDAFDGGEVGDDLVDEVVEFGSEDGALVGVGGESSGAASGCIGGGYG